MYNFPREFLDEVYKQIDTALDSGATPIAAFDADGTLWASDMGENMFKYQAYNGHVKDWPDEADPWEYYLKMHDEKPKEAYLWLAQINKNNSIEQVRKWAREALTVHPEVGLFAGQKEVISYLKKKKVKIFIVTASVKWAVEPAAEMYGIPQENVIGIETKIEDGIVSNVQGGPITWREGKVDGLLEKTGGKKPFFAAGNTKGDLPLLESASHVRLVLNSADKDHSNFNSENEMIELAKENNWLHHSWV